MLVLELFKKFAEQEQGKKVSGVEIVALMGPSKAPHPRDARAASSNPLTCCTMLATVCMINRSLQPQAGSLPAASVSVPTS